MKTVLKLSLTSVLKNPLRSIITFLCVILSSALISAICGFCVMIMKTVSPEDTSYFYYVGACILLISVVTAAAIVIIRSVFTVSFNERVNLLGLLATVGMTNGGKALLVFSETAVYGIFGSLMGTALGCGLLKWYIDILNNQLYLDYISRYGFDEIIPTDQIFYEFQAPVYMLVLSVSVSLLAVILSSVKPMKRAARLSIIDSMKSDVRINISLREGIVEKIMCRFFGRLGRLAGQNFDNNAPRYRAVSMSLSVCSVLFINFYAFVMWGNWDEGIYDPFIDPYVTAMLILGFALTFVAFIGAFGSAVSNINGRTREFAVFKSLGMSNSDMFRLLCCESLLILAHTAIYSLVVCLISVYGQFQFFWMSMDVRYFHFPMVVWLIFFGLDILFCLFFAIYAVMKIRRTNIAYAMK